MKEKTFEELLNDCYTPYGRDLITSKVLKLLQQVREATIAECEQIAFDNLDFHSCEDVRNDLYNMPTDRIKLTEKN